MVSCIRLLLNINFVTYLDSYFWMGLLHAEPKRMPLSIGEESIYYLKKDASVCVLMSVVKDINIQYPRPRPLYQIPKFFTILYLLYM